MSGIFYDSPWAGHVWSEWTPLHLENQDLSEIEPVPGIYRVRHHDIDGLVYIGQAGYRTDGGVDSRIQTLAKRTYKERMPKTAPHTAAPSLWAIRDQYGGEFEVSYTTESVPENKHDRLGEESLLIAKYRREFGKSPSAQFGRIIPGYKRSTSRSRGGRISSNEVGPKVKPSISPKELVNAENILSGSWMGYQWSDEFLLKDRLNILKPKERPQKFMYKIWHKGQVPPLAYIGQSTDYVRRTRSHLETYGRSAYFSYAEIPELESEPQREEIENDLIAAHYKHVGEIPLNQERNNSDFSPPV